MQSPHIMKDTKEIWLNFIKRDIPKWEEYGIPEEPKSWHQVYRDLRAQLQKEVDKDAEKLRQAMEGIDSERAKHSTMVMSGKRTARLPQERPSQRQRYASYDRKVGGIAPVFTPPNAAQVAADPLGAPKWTFERPQIPRSTEPKKNSIFSTKKMNKALAVPTKKLNDKASQVRVAPRSLIEDHKQLSTPPVAARKITPTLRVPGRSKPLGGQRSSNPAAASASSLQEKEKRLRALTTGNPLGSQVSKSPEAPSKISNSSTRARSTSTSELPTASPVAKKTVTPSAATSTKPLASKVTPPASSLQDKAQESSPRGLKRGSPGSDHAEEPKKKGLKRSGSESDRTEEPKEKGVKRTSPESDRAEESKQKVLKRTSPELNSEGDESKADSPPAPRIAVIKKRPASVFIPPKRKRLA